MQQFTLNLNERLPSLCRRRRHVVATGTRILDLSILISSADAILRSALRILTSLRYIVLILIFYDLFRYGITPLFEWFVICLCCGGEFKSLGRHAQRNFILEKVMSTAIWCTYYAFCRGIKRGLIESYWTFHYLVHSFLLSSCISTNRRSN